MLYGIHAAIFDPEEEASDLSVTVVVLIQFWLFFKGKKNKNGKLPLGEALGQAQILRSHRPSQSCKIKPCQL
jgi:hypothetical protein